VAAQAGDASRRRADGAARGRGKKIRVSKLENIINDIKILKIKHKLKTCCATRGYGIDWINRWAVMLPVVYTMYATAINISVVYMFSIRHGCIHSRGVHAVRYG
jgi:hypothetical protein